MLKIPYRERELGVERILDLELVLDLVIEILCTVVRVEVEVKVVS